MIPIQRHAQAVLKLLRDNADKIPHKTYVEFETKLGELQKWIDEAESLIERIGYISVSNPDVIVRAETFLKPNPSVDPVPVRQWESSYTNNWRW